MTKHNLQKKGLKELLLKIYDSVLKIYDPIVTLKIGRESIIIPYSHRLSRTIKKFPQYNTNLPRIIKYINDVLANVTVIDIGANIGDTVAFIKNYTDVPILCIDGNENYIKILKKNISKYSNVSFSCTLVGNETKESKHELVSEKGTAYLKEAQNMVSIRKLTDILDEFPDFKNSKILKSDTDGFDTIILRGCSTFLSEKKPILFFEFDTFLITQNNDNPFEFLMYLKSIGYEYLIIYLNTGEYFLSLSITNNETILEQLVDYFTNITPHIYADICAFHKQDFQLFNLCVEKETQYFKQKK